MKDSEKEDITNTHPFADFIEDLLEINQTFDSRKYEPDEKDKTPFSEAMRFIFWSIMAFLALLASELS